jgi:hypothetical protein
MPDSLTPETLNTLRLAIVFTPGAWQRAILLDQSDYAEKLQVDRLSHVLRATFEAHLAYPQKPYVLFEVVHIEPTDHFDHDLQEPGQPSALLIALAGEHQR